MTTKPTSTPMTAIVLGRDGKTVLAHARAKRVLGSISPAALSGAGAFLDGCSNLFRVDGTVVTAHVPVEPWGAAYGDPRSQLAAFMQDARAAGWRCTDAALTHNSGWVTFTHHGEDGKPDRPTVHLGVCSAMPEDPRLFSRDWPAEQIAQQLATYAAGVGVPYRTTAGITGCEVIRRYHESKLPSRTGIRSVPTWVWKDAGAVMKDISTPGDIVWERKLRPEEKRRPWVHVFDVNKQYLAAMAAVNVSWAGLEQCGSELFDPDRGGLWEIRIANKDRRAGTKNAQLPPLLNLSKITPSGLTWVTTPIAAQLQRMGVPFEVWDSYLGPRTRFTNADGKEIPGSGRWLREPAERIRNALAMHGKPVGHDRTCLCQPCRLLATFKDTVNAAVGMMAAPGSALRRPDVAAQIRDHARMTLMLKLHNAYRDHELSPVRVVHDAVFYVSEDPSPETLAKQLGAVKTGQIGRFKHDRTLSMADYITETTQRRAARVRRPTGKPASVPVDAPA